MLRTAENPIRLALLDDHAIVRHGLSNRFSKEPDLHVVGIYATAREMIGGLRGTPAEVLVVDYSLGPTEIDGINLLQVLKIKYPMSKILVASSHNNPATVELMMRAGAKGFVAKTEPLSIMVEAIRGIAAGGTYARGIDEDCPEEPRLLLAQDEHAVDASAALNAKEKNRSLSPREREVIRCCLDGMSVIEIAQKFSKSRKTISNQKQSAMSKLGLRTDSELFEWRGQGNDFI